MKHLSLLLFVALALGVPQTGLGQADRGFSPGQDVLAPLATMPLEILTETGRHTFTVEVAKSEKQRAQGLMFRPALAPDRGMLFLYPRPQVITMWMKNTLIPLDMLFLDAGGRVVSIHERAIPGSLRVISSGVQATAVLEVAGGTVERFGVPVGARVVSPALNDR